MIHTCLWQNMVCSLWHFMTNFFSLTILPAFRIAFFSEFKTLTFQYCCWSGPLKSEVWWGRFRIWRIILKVLVFTHDIMFAASVMTETHNMLQVLEEGIEKYGLRVSQAKWTAFKIHCRNKTWTDTGPSLLYKET